MRRRGRSFARAALQGAAGAVDSGLQLDRLLFRRQRRRWLGPFLLGRQCDRRGLSGAQVGGTAGYNWQLGRGLRRRGRSRLVEPQRHHHLDAVPGRLQHQRHWLSTVRGRVGYAFGGIMPYVTGGLAVGDIRAATPGLPATAPPMPAGRRRRSRSRAARQLDRKSGISARRPRQVQLRTDCGAAPTDNVSMHDNRSAPAWIITSAGANRALRRGRAARKSLVHKLPKIGCDERGRQDSPRCLEARQKSLTKYFKFYSKRQSLLKTEVIPTARRCPRRRQGKRSADPRFHPFH